MQRIRRTKFSLGSQKGLTLVELSIVLVIIGLLIPILFVFLVKTYEDVFYLDDKLKTSSQAKQALWFMEDNVRVSKGFLKSVPSPFTDAYGPRDAGSTGNDVWSYKGNTSASRVLISSGYSTTTNAFDTGRQPVFIDSPEFNCTTDMHYQPQLTYLSIYFLKDNTLYRRVLTDTTSALCPGNVQQQKQSCPPYIAQGSRHSSCQANDEVLLSNVSSFAVQYYQATQDGNSVEIDPTYTSTDPDILASADYVNVTITTSTMNGGTTNTYTQRMTKVNQ